MCRIRDFQCFSMQVVQQELKNIYCCIPLFRMLHDVASCCIASVVATLLHCRMLHELRDVASVASRRIGCGGACSLMLRRVASQACCICCGTLVARVASSCVASQANSMHCGSPFKCRTSMGIVRNQFLRFSVLRSTTSNDRSPT